MLVGFFFGIDPLYLIMVIPCVLLAAWAQMRVQSAFAEGQKYRSSSGISGAQAAADVLRAAGVTNVEVEPVEGYLSDHYDPKAKVLRLSPDVYSGQSLSALGVACHEAGHAVQDATGYPLLVLRNGLVPLASFGSNLSWVLISLGLLLLWLHHAFGRPVLIVGIIAFAVTVVFQIINLPVEFDASRRSRTMLLNYGIITEAEDVVVKKVLDAAATTYVAATLTGIMQLLYFLIRAGLLGGSRDE